MKRDPRAVATRFLGYPILVGEKTIQVYTPNGLFVGEAASVKQARLMVRGYRRAERQEQVA